MPKPTKPRMIKPKYVVSWFFISEGGEMRHDDTAPLSHEEAMQLCVDLPPRSYRVTKVYPGKEAKVPDGQLGMHWPDADPTGHGGRHG